MSIDIGRVFSNTLKMVQERWMTMIALWATFIGALIVYFLLVYAVIGGTFMALAGAGMSGPNAMGNLIASGGGSVGFFVVFLVLYFIYIAILLGQYASLVAAASPLQRLGFSEAFGRGLKGGLTLIGVALLFMLAYLVVLLVLTLATVILSLLGELGGIILLLVLIPAGIYVACRFSMIIPVIVVEKVFNPITAINRSWQITSGKVLGIFLTLLAFVVLAAVVVVPVALLMGGMLDPSGMGGAPGIGSILVFFLGFMVLSFAFLLSYSALIASLHAEVSDTQASEFSKAFE